MTPNEASAQLSKLLGLKYAPVGVESQTSALAAEAPRAPAPSACRFWRLAEREAVSADAAAHANCKIGAHVMGFALDADAERELGQLVETMTGVTYIAPEEVPAIPRLPDFAAWRYSPLAKNDSMPELALMWFDGRQVMLVQEAMGSAHWRAGKGLRTTGRPACAALALAYHHGEPVLSFGCAGMRTFTEIPDGLMLFVLPGELLEGLCRGLAQTAQANGAVQQLYDRHLERFGS